MRTLALALITALSCGPSLADGLPVREGKITSPHTLFDLSSSQLEEMEVLNSVTLNSDQWREIKAISPHIPKRLEGILPITWNDCLCCHPCGAILQKDGKIAVLHQRSTSKSLAWNLTKDPEDLRLQIDGRGNFYLQGKEVEIDLLVEAIRLSPKAEPPSTNSEPPSARIGLPAALQMSTIPEALQKPLTTVYRELSEKGWSVPERYLEESAL